MRTIKEALIHNVHLSTERVKPTLFLLALGLVFATGPVLKAPSRPLRVLTFSEVLSRELPVISLKMRRPCTSTSTFVRVLERCR